MKYIYLKKNELAKLPQFLNLKSRIKFEIWQVYQLLM